MEHVSPTVFRGRLWKRPASGLAGTAREPGPQAPPGRALATGPGPGAPSLGAAATQVQPLTRSLGGSGWQPGTGSEGSESDAAGAAADSDSNAAGWHDRSHGSTQPKLRVTQRPPSPHARPSQLLSGQVRHSAGLVPLKPQKKQKESKYGFYISTQIDEVYNICTDSIGWQITA
jgi:hypothetical protein